MGPHALSHLFDLLFAHPRSLVSHLLVTDVSAAELVDARRSTIVGAVSQGRGACRRGCKRNRSHHDEFELTHYSPPNTGSICSCRNGRMRILAQGATRMSA